MNLLTFLQYWCYLFSIVASFASLAKNSYPDFIKSYFDNSPKIDIIISVVDTLTIAAASIAMYITIQIGLNSGPDFNRVETRPFNRYDF